MTNKYSLNFDKQLNLFMPGYLSRKLLPHLSMNINMYFRIIVVISGVSYV